MKSLNINPNSTLDSYEINICKKLNNILKVIEGDNNRDWTIAVLDILRSVKNKNNKIACSKLDNNLKDCGEWLFDYIEYQEINKTFSNNDYNILSDIHLIVEIEWNHYFQKNYFIDLKYDFEKLLVGKSNYRLFIFEHDNLSFIKKYIESFKIIAENFKKFHSNERLLFAGWHKSNSFYFDNFIK